MENLYGSLPGRIYQPEISFAYSIFHVTGNADAKERYEGKKRVNSECRQ